MKYKTSKFNYVYECEDGSIRMYNSMFGAKSLVIVKPAVSAPVSAFLQKGGSCDDLPEYVKAPLVERGYLVPFERDEELALAVKASETVFNEKYLSLIIMPTEQCNFRCKYCYKTFAKGKMTSRVRDSLVKYVQKNISGYTGLSVVWFGGEPLEALDVVEELSEKFIEICKKAKKMYVSGITTNGYGMTPEVFERLYKLNIYTYQVTLDGCKTQHDAQRMLKNGEETFDTIVKNLLYIKNARKVGTVVMLRTNFTKAIIDNIDEYLSFYKENFGNDRHFTFYIQKASD